MESSSWLGLHKDLLGGHRAWEQVLNARPRKQDDAAVLRSCGLVPYRQSTAHAWWEKREGAGPQAGQATSCIHKRERTLGPRQDFVATLALFHVSQF